MWKIIAKSVVIPSFISCSAKLSAIVTYRHDMKKEIEEQSGKPVDEQEISRKCQ